MSNLSSIEKLKIEKLFGMGSGYVLNFSNRTFSEFIIENTGIEIFDSKYDYGSKSKANRLRRLWQLESNAVVGELLFAFLEYWVANKHTNDLTITPEEQALYNECLKILDRLKEETPIHDVQPNSNQKRPLKVSLSHAHSDAKAVRALYDQLTADGVDAWLDKEELLLRRFNSSNPEP